MKPDSNFRSRSFLIVLLAAPLLAASAADPVAKLKVLPSGAMSKMGGYYPLRLALSGEKPAGLGKLPGELAAPLFGAFKLGPAEAPQSFAVVLDEPDGKPSRLFVDANGNGDLTDDPAPEWTSRPVKGSDGKDYSQFSGATKVELRLGGETHGLTVRMYRFDKRDPARAAQAGFLFHYPDYAREGEVTVGDKTYKALLADRQAIGDFRGKEGSSSGVQLFLDVNGNGRFESATESFDVRQPFNIAGTTYEIAGLTAGGESFRVQKSAKVVAEKKAAPAAPRPELLAVGKPATVFKAKTTDGKDVDFPASFKGKVVLLDFWAIWCGPCIGELPHLTAAYQKFHGKGFEVLGISLDRPGDDKKLAAFTKDKNMPWPQVYDGKYWQAEVAQLYGVRSIPTAYLVDGDTGLVIANSGLRGTQLEKTIEAALEKKGLAGK
jgi:peroxiredoxin